MIVKNGLSQKIISGITFSIPAPFTSSPNLLPQQVSWLMWAPGVAALVECFSFIHSNYFYLESVALDSECLSHLSSSVSLIGKNDGSMEWQEAGWRTERWKVPNKNSSVQIKIYVKLCKPCKWSDSLKDAYVQFTDLWLALSNIHEQGEYLPKAWYSRKPLKLAIIAQHNEKHNYRLLVILSIEFKVHPLLLNASAHT